MNPLSSARGYLDRIQKYASAYFEILYKTIFVFWKLPPIPTGGNILTGAFAAALIYSARSHLGRPLDGGPMTAVLVSALFFILLLCGIAIAFDPKLATGGSRSRVENMKKLVSVACVGVTLGCAFILLNKLFPWIQIIFEIASKWQLETGSAYRLVATMAALGAGLVIFANTVFKSGLGHSYRAPDR